MNFSIEEKPIPETTSLGVPDPRVLQLWLNAQQNPQKPAVGIAEIRASMGWPNLDLSYGQIESESITLESRAGPLLAIVNRPRNKTIKLPGILYFHGGGFMGGSTTTVQNPCRFLAEKADAIVFNIDYRLAPEFPFPAPLEDCYDALCYIYDHANELGVDPTQIAVAGDSAGGNLAAACCVLDSKQPSRRIAAQLLVYPVLDQRPESDGHIPWDIGSYQITSHGEYIVPSINGLRGAAPWFSSLYLKGLAAEGVSPKLPSVSPLLHEPGQFPPTLVITAEYDYLRIEGEVFARQLAQAGCEVRAIRYRGMDHAFLDKLGLFPQAGDAINEMAQFLKKLTRPSS